MTESQSPEPEVEDGEAEALRHDYVLTFRRRIEERAFADLMSWVPTLIQGAIYQTESQKLSQAARGFQSPRTARKR